MCPRPGNDRVQNQSSLATISNERASKDHCKEGLSTILVLKVPRPCQHGGDGSEGGTDVYDDEIS